MDDFTRWLYANYIKPHLDSADHTGYEQALSLMDTTLDRQLRTEYNRALEFCAGHAFLLGVRTGAGLAPILMENPH